MLGSKLIRRYHMLDVNKSSYILRELKALEYGIPSTIVSLYKLTMNQTMVAYNLIRKVPMEDVKSSVVGW